MNEALKTLIRTTPSMTDIERGYWFQLEEHMTKQQVDWLFNILSNERKQLDELEALEWQNDCVSEKDLEKL